MSQFEEYEDIATKMFATARFYAGVTCKEEAYNDHNKNDNDNGDERTENNNAIKEEESVLAEFQAVRTGLEGKRGRETFR